MLPWLEVSGPTPSISRPFDVGSSRSIHPASGTHDIDSMPSINQVVRHPVASIMYVIIGKIIKLDRAVTPNSREMAVPLRLENQREIKALKIGCVLPLAKIGIIRPYTKIRKISPFVAARAITDKPMSNRLVVTNFLLPNRSNMRPANGPSMAPTMIPMEAGKDTDARSSSNSWLRVLMKTP